MKHLLVYLLLICAMTLRSRADCESLRCFVAVVEVKSAVVVDPTKETRIADFVERYKRAFPNNSGDQQAARIVESYRGLILDCSVLSTKQSTNSTDWVHHNSSEIQKFFYPTKDPELANGRFKKTPQIEIMVQESCCDGDPNVPCLLGLRFYLKDTGNQASHNTPITEASPRR